MQYKAKEQDAKQLAQAKANGSGAYNLRWLGDGAALTTEEMALVQ